MPPAPLIDSDAIDTSKVLFGVDEIRQGNPQRFEMEQLSAIVHFSPDEKLIVGYKDLGPEEFWVRGHMPGYPLMPGVMMCEAAAQLCSFYCHAVGVIREGFLGFGGMEDVRFRGPVRPGDRLLVAAKAIKIHRHQMIFDTQGFVGNNMVFHARIIGMILINNPRADA
jgi:3-hydroxyacyl-[acyl-carrier-protein] dehydratase